MKIGDFLDSINTSKKNLIRGAESPAAAEKLYPAYPVQRCMALHQDAILYANELNIRGRAEFGLRPRQQYEFFLHAVTKKKRFAKWDKAIKDDQVEIIAEIYTCSIARAREIQQVLSSEQVQSLIELHSATGGVAQKRTPKPK